MGRGSNFLDEEDAQLARSWLHTSMHPIFANSMKKDQFWVKCAEHFNENTSGQHREGTSLKYRWSSLRPAVSRFCGIYSSIERNPPSGSGPSDWIAQAKILFQDQTDKGFTFERAWIELRDKPKWKSSLEKNPAPALIRTTEVSSPAATPTPSTNPPNNPPENNPDTPTPSGDGSRPTGIKAAKRALTHTELLNKKLKLMETTAGNTHTMSQKRYSEMARANDIQEKLVNMDILSKDLLTCVDEYELAYFTQAKKDIITQMEARRNQPCPDVNPNPTTIENSESQASSSLAPINNPSSHAPSSEPNKSLLRSDGDEYEQTSGEEGEQPNDNHDPGNACDNNKLPIDPAIFS